MRRSRLDQYNYNQVNPEKVNDDLSEELSNKVSALKSLSIEIGSELKYQNSLLPDMQNTFETSSGFLQSSMKRLGNIAKMGSHKFILYLVLYCFIILFILYLYIKLK